MATQLTATSVRRREMQEVKAPEMFQFTKDNSRIEGVLLGLSSATVKGKETLQYLMQDLDGNRFTFLATYDLARKITPQHVGHWLIVVYEGEDPDVKTQGLPLRRFRVQVSKDKEPGFQNVHGVTATDEDIPF